MSPYTIVLCKSPHVLVKRQLHVESPQGQLKKTAVVKAWAYMYVVSVDKKTTVYKLEALKICGLAIHSNVLLCFTDLPASSSL